jgi:SAM-dependent methyltransferase
MSPHELSLRRRPNSRTLGRSIRLFRMFLREQSEPRAFYEMLADDTCTLIEEYFDLDGSLLLDVGGGPGYLAEAAERRGARAVTVDISFEELHLHGRTPSAAIVGDATGLPLRSDSFDVVHASNVAEHLASREELVSELSRVVKPSGVVFLSFTPWLSPWGGHETSPWHYLGGEYAAKRYRARHGREPKNRYLSTLFPVYVGEICQILGTLGLEVIDAFPRYYPRWATPLARIPLLREVATWNYSVVFAKR